MKTKILALLLALVMVVSMLASCELFGGGDPEDTECTAHIDKDGDKVCDICSTQLTVTSKPATGDNGESLPAITWATKPELLFQMTDNTNNDELSSGCRRFLSGESDSTGFVEQNAKDRNDDAYEYANVNVTYTYYPNTTGYGWGGGIEKMLAAATSDTEKGRPDMFCNFVYDMVSTSLLSAFNNLYTNKVASEGVKAGEIQNYFAFAKDGEYNTKYKDTGDGYMVEYMQSLTLSEKKMYLLASDYFTDLVRAFFAVPVNISLLESGIGENVSTTKGDWNYDYNENGTYELSDFYRLVNDNLWTYDAVKGFSNAVYKAPNDTSDVLNPDGKGVYGFAIGAGGLGASGLLYTTSVTVIDRQVTTKIDYVTDPNGIEYQDYTFSYPDPEKDANASKPLEEFVGNLKALFGSTGVVCISKDATLSNTKSTESTEKVVRNAFANDQVLFGGIVCVGSLEDDVYGDMVTEDGGGFGVVPVPLYRNNYTDTDGTVKTDKYLTQIHNIGRVGAIGVKTKYFAQCSAFLNYQSLNSAQILDDYYDMTLKTDVAGDAEGNAEMLDYIRENVRSSFDKAFEDAVARHYMKSGDTQMNGEKWHNQILAAKFQMESSAISEEYARLRIKKQTSLEALEQSYTNLPA
ncbi:MAG: hypothetical protein IKC87_01630 [Clostridia bacterium]|nr:hypothetical protein [Clostridia bacterium]